jgi:hypothetical protein
MSFSAKGLPSAYLLYIGLDSSGAFTEIFNYYCEHHRQNAVAGFQFKLFSSGSFRAINGLLYVAKFCFVGCEN